MEEKEQELEQEPTEEGGESQEAPEEPQEQEEGAKDTLSDEEKEEKLAQAREKEPPPEPVDPTKGMSDGQKMDYWMKRANHFEGEYKTEREKRQQYAKKFGGLSGGGKQIAGSAFENYKAPRSLDEVSDLGGYTRYLLQEAEKAFEYKMSEKQLDQKVYDSEVRAREIHDGGDGLPTYDELVDEHVVPMVQKNPRIFELIKLMPDPAEASYTLGFLLKYPKFSDMLKGQARDDLVKAINQTSKQAAGVRGRGNGHQPSGKLTKRDIDNMTPEEFEKELDRWRAES